VDATVQLAEVRRLRTHTDANPQTRATWALRSIKAQLTRASGLEPLSGALKVVTVNHSLKIERYYLFIRVSLKSKDRF